jgi:hypothetical protein
MGSLNCFSHSIRKGPFSELLLELATCECYSCAFLPGMAPSHLSSASTSALTAMTTPDPIQAWIDILIVESIRGALSQTPTSAMADRAVSHISSIEYCGDISGPASYPWTQLISCWQRQLRILQIVASFAGTPSGPTCGDPQHAKKHAASRYGDQVSMSA